MVAPPGRALLSGTFNQDFSCLAIGTRSGYAIMSCEPFRRVYTKRTLPYPRASPTDAEDEPTALVAMLFSTSLVATVANAHAPDHTSACRLKIVNTKRESTICELTFPSTILQVQLNRRRLIVVLAAALYVYDISNMKLLHTIDTQTNPQGVCALVPSSEPCWMAYPAPGAAHADAPPGQVVVYDLLTMRTAKVLLAHRTRIACLAMNAAGTLLATASEKGTIVRVFSLPDGQPLYHFRRGSYAARIVSMTFNAASTLLCVSSDTETVHLFRLAPPTAPTAHDPDRARDHQKRAYALLDTVRQQSIALGKSVTGSVGSYLPAPLTEMWEPTRDFAFLKLPAPGVRAVCAVSNTLPQVLVLTNHGFLYVYALDLERGGECLPIKQYALLDSGTT